LCQSAFLPELACRARKIGKSVFSAECVIEPAAGYVRCFPSMQANDARDSLIAASQALGDSGLPAPVHGEGSASDRLVDVALIGVDPFRAAGMMVDQLFVVEAQKIENG